MDSERDRATPETLFGNSESPPFTWRVGVQDAFSQPLSTYTTSAVLTAIDLLQLSTSSDTGRADAQAAEARAD